MDPEDIAYDTAPVEKYQHDGTTVTAVRFPANGSMPQLVALKTVITFHGDHIVYEPEFREYWGVAWFQHEEFSEIELKNQTDKKFDGMWYFTRCLDGSSLPPNQHFPGAFGDIFLLKMDASGSGEDDPPSHGNVPEDWEQCYGLQRALCALTSNENAWVRV